MTSKRVMQFGGITLITIALVLMVRTGSVALVLGAAPVTGMPFWFQLSFVRLFATALAGLGAIFLWSASHLSSDQLRSLVSVVTFVLGGIGLVSATQQIAIWGSNSGWILCGVSAAVVSPRRA